MACCVVAVPIRPAAVFLSLIPLTMSAADSDHHRVREYRDNLIGKQAMARSAAGAGFGQIRNLPREWGRGVAGFAKRFGSSVGQRVVKETIQLGVGAWRHEDLRYRRSNLTRKWPRLKYAVVHTLVVPRDKGPQSTVAVGRIAGSVGSGLISRL